MNNSNNNCNKEVFYLGHWYHNNPFTNNRYYKKDEYTRSTNLSWHCCDKTPSCCQHKCKKGTTGCTGPTGPTGPKIGRAHV